jgi:hypothetical protein
MGQTVNLLSFDFGGSNPSYPTSLTHIKPQEKDLRSKILKSQGVSGSSSIGRAPAFQAGGCGFETRLPLQAI